MKSQLKVNDKLWKEIKSKIPQIDKVVVKTGIQSDAGENEDVSNEEENEDVSIAEYAYFNEFGTKTIPERPFMRKTFDDNISNWNTLTERLIKGILDNKIDVKSAFDLLGEQTEADMKDTITNGNFIDNAQSTIDKKGSTRPLVDSSAMLNAIRYEVEGI